MQAWDMATGTCKHTLNVHTDKVQALAWNPKEASCILSGGFDKRACISDLRAPGEAVASWSTSADVESLAWSYQRPTQFAVSAESGDVVCFDTRRGAGGDAVWTLAAHDKAASSIAFNPLVPDLLVTGSIDKTVRLVAHAQNGVAAIHFDTLGSCTARAILRTRVSFRELLQVKLWDVSDDAPKLVASQDLGVGAIFAVGIPSDAAHLVAAGGAKGEVAVWDLQLHEKLKRAYKQHFKSAGL
jgi:periodic tryptophan protein 1